MKYQLPTLIVALSFLSLTSQAQTLPTDSTKKTAKEKAAEQQGKADVYHINKTQGKKLTDGEDSVVATTEKTHKVYKKKTRKTSCGVKPARKSTT